MSTTNDDSEFETCKGCSKKYKRLLTHISQKENCKEAYGSEYEALKKEKNIAKKRNYNSKNRTKILEKQANYYEKNSMEIRSKVAKYKRENSHEIRRKHSEYNQKNSELIKVKQRQYNKIKRIWINLKQRKRTTILKDSMTKKDRFVAFKQEIKDGPSFVCYSCDRALFQRGVSILQENDMIKLKEKAGESFLYEKIFRDDDDYSNSQWIFCHSCLTYIKKKEVPKIHVSNGLQLDDIPDSLKLTELEQQLIAKDIVFMKIKKLPKSRMNAILDRVINVPVQDEDIIKTVTSLPRPPDKAGIVGVRLKRKMDLKNAHIESFVRPHMLFEALKTLKNLGNIHYKDIEIDLDFLEKQDDIPMEIDSDSGSSDPDSDSFDNDDILDAVKKGQAKKDSHTCLIPINPEEDIVVNESNTTLYKRLKESGRSHEIAPGENKRPSNWCREKDFDVKSNPTLHPSGQYGLNHDRPVKISAQMYFNQRLLNIDDRFAACIAYLFMAQQFTERLALERQMEISGQRGVAQRHGDTVKVSLKDPFSMFAQVKGTPKYWQKARNELIAKVKVLGPFQVFFTLSCAEMRWSEIFVAVLRRKGYTVKCIEEEDKGWDGNDDNILVNGKKLWDFVESMDQTKHELLKDHVVLVTRMFDERVKSFIKNLLMGKGKDKVSFLYYTYRIEMQDRGLPHVHGVAWIDPEWLESEHEIHGNLIDSPENEVIKLTDKLVSCSINSGDKKLDQIVKQVQKHNHSKSCKKYGTSCRFGFPKLPSRKTKIAKPLSGQMDTKEKKAKEEKAKEIVEKAKTLLESPDLDENMSLDDFIKSLNVSELDYDEAIGIMEKGNQIVLKRNVNERFINNFNPEIAKAWDGNTDFQIALDPFAVVTYMVSYVAKDETGMTKFLKQTLTANLDKPLSEKLKALKMAYLKNKQMGASEAVYRVLPGMHLKHSNITTIFIQSGFPENRTVHFKRIPEENFDEDEALIYEEDIEDDGEETVQAQIPGSKTVKIANKAGNYSQTIPIHDRYVV